MNDVRVLIVKAILGDIQCKKNEWNYLFSGKMRRIADWDEPIPDYVYMDIENDKTVAFFFTLPNQEKEYYLEYIEKSVKILNRHDYCILILPEYVGVDSIGTIIETRLYEQNLSSLPIALLEYLPDVNIDSIVKYNITRRLIENANRSVQKTRTEKKSYWCWWRDASYYEIFQLLELSQKYNSENGDIYTKYIYPEFYELMIGGNTKQWNSKPRHKTFSKASFKAEKQNYKIPLVQLGLWTHENGKITPKGRKLLFIGGYYGPESEEYFNSLAKMILLDGKHLDLIREVVEFQKKNASIIPETSEEFFVLLDLYLTGKESMGTRKPTAVKTGAKKAYVRDEPKLWNKLGLVITQSGGRYFKPYEGIEFDWNKINSILLA